MVVCPAPDARVEGGDEGGLVTSMLGVDEFMQLFQVTLLSFEAGLDDALVATFAVMFAHPDLPDGEAEKVNTCAGFVFVVRVFTETAIRNRMYNYS